MYSSKPARFLATALAVVLAVALEVPARAQPSAPCAAAARDAGWRAPIVVSGDRVESLDAVVSRATKMRAVYVGEAHDRYDHHLTQLEVACRLHRAGVAIAIGLEMFQRPFQRHLDDYVGGRVGLDEMLHRTEYFDRWRYDARLYAPIFEFARERGIRLIALNAEAELVAAISRGGLDSLDDPQRALLPDMPSPQPDAYLERLRAVYGEHPQNPHSDFGRFVSIQVLWDETMADTAARYLGEHPDRTLVVLAGKGHVAWGSGIPARVTRRSGSPGLTLVNESPGPAADPRSADHLLLSHAVALAPAGLMGVFLEAGEKGLLVTKVSPGGAAEAAGIVDGENIEAIGGAEVRRFADVKSRLWRERPGTEITLRVRAKGGDARRDVVLVLR